MKKQSISIARNTKLHKAFQDFIMRDYFIDILLVIAYSGKISAAIFLGILGFIIIQLVGDYALSDFKLSGNLSILTDTIKEKFDHRYD
jgi:cell division septal protein FtsQ